MRRVRDVQVIGGPAWLDTAEFYVSAKGDPSPSDSQCGGMVQALLEDRFKLSIQKEMRSLPVYALVTSPKGVKIHESAAPRPDMSGGPGKLNARDFLDTVVIERAEKPSDN